VDFVKHLPVLFLHCFQDGRRLEIGDKEEIAPRCEFSQQFIDAPQRHFAVLKQFRSVDSELRLPGDPFGVIGLTGNFNDKIRSRFYPSSISEPISSHAISLHLPL
jgi:hypothetical protein